MPLHPQAQRLQPLGNQEGVERGDGRAQVTQQLDAGLEDVGKVGSECTVDAQVPAVDQPVVAGVRGVEAGEAIRLPGVVEGAAVDDHAGDRAAVAAQVLGGGMHDDVGPPLERADQVGGGQGVVHDQRDAGFVRHRADALEVQHILARVGDHLAEEQLGVGLHRVAPVSQVVRVLDKGDLDAELRQRGASRLYVPPYRLGLATIWSPASAILRTAKVTPPGRRRAAAPPTPPSRLATRVRRPPGSGLPIRV